MNNWGLVPILSKPELYFFIYSLKDKWCWAKSQTHPPACMRVSEGRGAAWSPLSFFVSLSSPRHCPFFPQTQKGWMWFLLSAATVSEACASVPLLCPLEPLASTTAVAMPLQSTPAKEVPQGMAFCRSSRSCTLLLLKSPRHPGWGAAFSSALLGLSSLHP